MYLAWPDPQNWTGAKKWTCPHCNGTGVEPEQEVVETYNPHVIARTG